MIPRWQLAWCCQPAPPDGDVLQRALQFAEQAKPDAQHAVWAEGVLQTLLLWSGRFDKRAAQVTEDFAKFPNEWTGSRLAIFHARAGRLKEARMYLDRTRPLLAEAIEKRRWGLYGDIELQLLYRTAEESIRAQEQKQAAIKK